MAGVAEEAVRITNMAAPVWNAGVMNAASLHDHANAFVGTVNDAALAFDKYAPTLTKVAEETFRIVDTAASMRNASVINVAPLSMDMGSLLPSASTSLLMRDGYVVGMRAPSQVVPELWEPPADRETPMHSAVAGEISSLLPVLEMCDQALVGPWSGVVERIERRGPDWVRHAAVSAREVLIATLACAAPSSEVIEMGFADPQTGREMHGSEPTYLAMARFAKARLAHTDLGRDNDLQPDDVVRLIRAVQVLVHGRSGSRSEADAELLLPRVGRVTRLLVAIRHS